MKKKLILGVLLSAFAFAGPAAASASATAAQTDITGVITESFTPVTNAHVSVWCNGTTLTDMTDSHGSYLTVFPIAQCAFGSTVKVTATKNGKSGMSSGTVQGITTKLNLAIVNVSIPEYGFVGALTAGSAGIGLIAYKRRRQQMQF